MNRAGLELTRTQSCPKSCAKTPGMDQDTGDSRGHGRGWSGCRGHDQAVPLEVTGNSETPAELWPPSRMLLIPCRDSSFLPVARTTSAAGLLQSALRSQLFPATASSESFKRPECPDQELIADTPLQGCIYCHRAVGTAPVHQPDLSFCTNLR